MDGEKAGGVLFMKGIAEFFRAFSLVRNRRAIRTRWDFQRRYFHFTGSMPLWESIKQDADHQGLFQEGDILALFYIYGIIYQLTHANQSTLPTMHMNRRIESNQLTPLFVQTKQHHNKASAEFHPSIMLTHYTSRTPPCFQYCL